MDDSPATLQTFTDAPSAHIARMRLAEHDIRAAVLDENTLTYDPLLMVAVGGIKLVVRKRDLQRARSILDMPKTKVEATCAECGSNDLQSSQVGRRSALWTMLLIGIPIGRAKTKVRCLGCGHCWRE